MSDIGKNALKTKIDNKVYENSSQAITGTIMNEVLQDMVDTLADGGNLDAGSVNTANIADGAVTDAKLQNPVSVSQNTETEHTDITVGDTTTPVASVKELTILNSLLDLTPVPHGDLEIAQDGKYIQPNGNIGTYAPGCISSIISIEKGQLVVAKMRANDAMCVIGRVTSVSDTWNPLVVGQDSSEPIYYCYVANTDMQIQLCYIEQYGVELDIYKAKRVDDIENEIDNIEDNILSDYVQKVNIIQTVQDNANSLIPSSTAVFENVKPLYAQLNIKAETQSVEIAIDGKYIQPNGSIGTYAPYCISEPLSLKRGQVLAVKAKCDSTACLIGKIIDEDTSFTPLVIGANDTSLTSYYYLALEDMDVQLSYRKDSGATAVIYTNDLYNNPIQNIFPVKGYNHIAKMVSHISISPICEIDDLSGENIFLRYVGFNDGDYINKFVCQIVRQNADGTINVLTNDFNFAKWIPNHTFVTFTNIGNIPVRIDITTGNGIYETYPITNVKAIVDCKYKEAEPVKELVSNNAKNLVDYNNALANWMVQSNTGNFEEVGSPWYLYKWIKVYGLSYITFGINGVAGDSSIYSYAFYDNSRKYISGSTVYPNGITEPLAVPSNAAYICFTSKYNDGKEQVNGGSTLQSFDVFEQPKYLSKQDKNGNSWSFKSGYSTEIHIGEGAEYDFNEIQPAINSIWAESVAKPFTLIVHPKTTPYAPFSMIRQSFDVAYPWSNVIPRYISIIGLDRVNCVIQSNTGDYYHPASELLANGNIQNLTFRLTNSEHLASSTQGGYAAHIDARTVNDVGYNMIIENCEFESATGPATGIGTHTNGNLKFINCSFISTADPTYSPIEGYTNLAHWGCIFTHSAVAAEDATNQKITFENCWGVSQLGSKSLWISNAGSTTLLVTLLRNIFWSNAQNAPSYDMASSLSYNPMNYGNNIPS